MVPNSPLIAPAHRRSPAPPRRRRQQLRLALGAILVALVASVVATATPAQAAPPPLSGPFTGILRADDNSTARVTGSFTHSNGVASGSFNVAPGGILQDCYGRGPKDIGALSVSLSGPRLGPLPSGGDQYSLRGQFQLFVTVTGPFGWSFPITDTVSLDAPAAELSADGSVLTIPVAVAIYPPFGLSPCTRNWTFELSGPPVTPFGYIDQVTGNANGTIRVEGWTIDPDATTTPTNVHVYLDGQWGTGTTANQHRGDVGAAYPGAGNSHGFDTTFSAPPGLHNVYVYAINTPGTNGLNPLLGIRTVTVTVPGAGPGPSKSKYHVTANPAQSRLNHSHTLVLTAVDDTTGAVVPGTFTIAAANSLTLSSGVAQTVNIKPAYDSYYDPDLGQVVREMICPTVTFQPQNPSGYSSGSWPPDLFACL